VKRVVEKEKPGTVFLTGGGSLISLVATYLKMKLREVGISLTHVHEAERLNGRDKWRGWRDTGEGLARLATALGGASVILQQSGLQSRREPLGPVYIPEPMDAYTECSCGGGNKDCCKCSGRGYYGKN
jgi:hypothetical protein